jgi:hypothetical protein
MIREMGKQALPTYLSAAWEQKGMILGLLLRQLLEKRSLGVDDEPGRRRNAVKRKLPTDPVAIAPIAWASFHDMHVIGARACDACMHVSVHAMHACV